MKIQKIPTPVIALVLFILSFGCLFLASFGVQRQRVFATAKEMVFEVEVDLQTPLSTLAEKAGLGGAFNIFESPREEPLSLTSVRVHLMWGAAVLPLPEGSTSATARDLAALVAQHRKEISELGKNSEPGEAVYIVAHGSELRDKPENEGGSPGGSAYPRYAALRIDSLGIYPAYFSSHYSSERPLGSPFPRKVISAVVVRRK